MKTRKITTALALVLLSSSLAACNNATPGQAETNHEEKIVRALSAKEQQLVFEEEYISAKYSYAEGGKFVMSMLSNIGNIAAGVGFDSPTSVVAGVFGILTSINDQFNGSSGPTIADVMNKLAEMDTKLDNINQKIDQNYNQLMNETIRTQAMVDQVLLEEMEAAIGNFNTNYTVPIENYRRDFADYLEQSYKAYVNEPEIIDIYVYKTETNDWALTPIADVDGTQKEITFKVEDFSNAKECLDKNYNTVTVGFMDSFIEDIDKAVETATIPEGLEKETCRNYATANIIEKITKNYYKENHQKALDIRNMAINYAKQISGKSVKSIVDRYVNRMEYMYNFIGEMKDMTTECLANILHSLDTNVTIAAQACQYAEVNQEEIRTEYIAARETIQKYYESIKDVDDRYCFLTNTIIGGGFYQARFNVGYTKKGNDCNFKSAFELNKVEDDNYIKDDPNNHYYLTQVDHTRIVTRMNLMRAIGLTKANSYIDYLVEAKALDKKDYYSYTYLLSKKWITEDALRFMTGINIRNMDDGDKNFKIECVDNGNPGGDYYHIGWTGTYRQNRDAGNWNGKIAETTYIDAITGEVMDDHRVAAYCTYNESHWYWTNDEHWAFIDNPAGNYFFILENIVAD